jgi:hypothetical protein
VTVWNHGRNGRIEGEIVQISEGGRWTYIKLAHPVTLTVTGQEVQAGSVVPFRTSLLNEDRSGTPGPAEIQMSARNPSSPDCRDENHRKCDGVAWDLLADQPCDCGCPCHA